MIYIYITLYFVFEILFDPKKKILKRFEMVSRKKIRYISKVYSIIAIKSIVRILISYKGTNV